MRKIPCISFVAIYILLFVVSANAQLKTPPVIEWQRSLGGSREDGANSIQQTTDGGYITAGSSRSRDGDVYPFYEGVNYWVVKLSPLGSIEWYKPIGGSNDDLAMSVRQAKDGSYIIAGYSESIDGNIKDHNGTDKYSDFWIVKLTNTGELDWERSLGGSKHDEAASVTPTFDGGYIAAGRSNSTDSMVIGNHGGYDCWIVKFSSNGVLEWTKSLGGSKYDAANSIQQTIDSGYIVAGFSYSSDGDVIGHHGTADSADFWIVKLSKQGDIQWQKSLGGVRGEEAYDIRQTKDNGYIVVGHSYSHDGDVTGHHGNVNVEDIWVVKLTNNGAIEWANSFGGTRYDRGYSVCETSDSGYVLLGNSCSDDGDVSFNHGNQENDYWLLKLSKLGTVEWEQSLGGSREDFAASVESTTDGGLIVAGTSMCNDGDVTGNHGAFDFWVVKLSPENPSRVEDELGAAQTASITPNPAQTTATLTLESNEIGMCEVQIISVTGVTLKQYSTHLTIGKQEIALTDLESLPSGMYEVLVKRSGYLVSQTKLIIE